MRKAVWIVMMAGLALVPCAPARSQAGQSGSTDQAAGSAAAAIPPEQQATREQLAKLFEVMRLRQQFESMMKMLPNMVQQQIHTQMKEMIALQPGAKPPTPEQQAALDKLMKKYMDKAQAVYPVDEMIHDAITVYQRHMSRSDVDAYIAFFSSIAGQHLLDAQPLIMKEYMPIAMERAQSRTKALYAEMAVDLQEFIKTEAPAK